MSWPFLSIHSHLTEILGDLVCTFQPSQASALVQLFSLIFISISHFNGDLEGKELDIVLTSHSYPDILDCFSKNKRQRERGKKGGRQGRKGAGGGEIHL